MNLQISATGNRSPLSRPHDSDFQDCMLYLLPDRRDSDPEEATNIVRVRLEQVVSRISELAAKIKTSSQALREYQDLLKEQQMLFNTLEGINECQKRGEDDLSLIESHLKTKREEEYEPHERLWSSFEHDSRHPYRRIKGQIHPLKPHTSK